MSNAAPGSGRGPAGIGHIEDGSDVGYAGTDRYEQLEGATQTEIDLMLDEFEEVYAPEDDDEGKLVMAEFSGKLLGSPLPLTV